MKEILQRYGELLADVDRWYAGCMALFDKEIYCQYGCCKCCHGHFDITLLDAAYLKRGFDALPTLYQQGLRQNASIRLLGLKKYIPGLSHPYILNYYPEEERERLLADEAETPCILLGYDGNCLLYDYRPMTCRLYGLPNIDYSGEVKGDAWCSLNFQSQDPLVFSGLRGDFAEIFQRETVLLGKFNAQVAGSPTAQLNTLIPAALLIDSP
jgi:Fe-S-cluster containining protein